MRPGRILLVAACVCVLPEELARAQNADFIWTGGPILAGKDLRPEALAVKDGKIAALGSRAEVEKKWKGKLTLPIDLMGQALVAGLVAGSPSAEPPPPPGRRGSKAAGAAILKAAPPKEPKPAPVPRPPALPALVFPAPSLEELAADLSPPKDGLPYSIASIRDALRIWILRSRLPARHRIVLGVGCDETKLDEKRLPTREELDTVSATMPVVVVSRTGDAGAYNTLALQKAGISWRTKDPIGGVIRRRGRINEPNGVLEGTAHAGAFHKLVPRLDEKERARLKAESVKLSTPEEPAAALALAAASPVQTPTPAPTPAAAPPVAASARPIPPGPREPLSPALAALVSDALAGRAAMEVSAPATLSVLSADPATADPAKLRVVEEVRRGRTVWRRDPTSR